MRTAGVRLPTQPPASPGTQDRARLPDPPGAKRVLVFNPVRLTMSAAQAEAPPSAPPAGARPARPPRVNRRPATNAGGPCAGLKETPHAPPLPRRHPPGRRRGGPALQASRRRRPRGRRPRPAAPVLPVPCARGLNGRPRRSRRSLRPRRLRRHRRPCPPQADARALPPPPRRPDAGQRRASSAPPAGELDAEGYRALAAEALEEFVGARRSRPRHPRPLPRLHRLRPARRPLERWLGRPEGGAPERPPAARAPSTSPSRPKFFGEVAERIHHAGLAGPQARIVIEKPLGHDLASARALNARAVRPASRSARSTGSTIISGRRRSRT